jgi:hypothetical protein
MNYPNFNPKPEILSFTRYYRKFLAKDYDNQFYCKLQRPDKSKIKQKYLKYKALKEIEIERYETGVSSSIPPA